MLKDVPNVNVGRRVPSMNDGRLKAGAYNGDHRWVMEIPTFFATLLLLMLAPGRANRTGYR